MSRALEPEDGGWGGGVRAWWRGEGGFEIEDVVKVVDVVGLGFLHEAGFDHGKDDVAEIVGAVDVPVGQNGTGHAAVADDGVIAEAAGELLAGDVVVGVVGLGFCGESAVDAFDGVVEALADEFKGFDGVSSVLFDDLLKGFARGFVHSPSRFDFSRYYRWRR